MPATIKNYKILDRFKELVKDYYTEPREEEILLLSWQSLCMILQYEHENLGHFKKKNTKRSNSEINIPDIKEMFRRQAENGQRNKRKDNNKVIVIY